MQKLFFIILFLLFIFFVNNAISRNKHQDTQNIQSAITENNISTERNTTTSQVQKQESKTVVSQENIFSLKQNKMPPINQQNNKIMPPVQQGNNIPLQQNKMPPPPINSMDKKIPQDNNFTQNQKKCHPK